MRLTVLGCAGTYPGPDSACSAYLLEFDGFRLVVDLGSGTLAPLQRYAELLPIDAVVVSHLHGDHWLDLIPYVYARRFHPTGQAPRLPVYGPAGTRDRLIRCFGSASAAELVDSSYSFADLDCGRRSIGPFELVLDRVNHPVPCFGMRISAGGRTLAYSADTGRTDALDGLAKDADLFLCEASYLDGEDNPPDIHLTGREAAEQADRSEVGRLVLTHLVPWGDPERTLAEATGVFRGPLEIARPGTSYDV